MKVTIWVCPMEGCGDYYASSSAGNLALTWNTDAKNQRTFVRSRCPSCHERGMEVYRQPVTVVLAQNDLLRQVS